MPIYVSEGISAQNAVNEAVVALEASKARLDVAADSLRESASREPLKYKHVSEWIDGCQSYCLGNLVWRFASPVPLAGRLLIRSTSVSPPGGTLSPITSRQKTAVCISRSDGLGGEVHSGAVSHAKWAVKVAPSYCGIGWFSRRTQHGRGHRGFCVG